jgi:hypothetical protein
MKTITPLIALCLLMTTAGVHAQMKRPVKEKVDAIKIGFITERLDLTPEEAQAFWPVYNQYTDELDHLRKDRRENLMNARENFDSMSDGELEKAVDNEIAFRVNELEILKKYHPQFKKILPVKKVAKLYRAEEDFKRRLLDMIKDRRNNRRMADPRGM